MNAARAQPRMASSNPPSMWFDGGRHHIILRLDDESEYARQENVACHPHNQVALHRIDRDRTITRPVSCRSTLDRGQMPGLQQGDIDPSEGVDVRSLRNSQHIADLGIRETYWYTSSLKPRSIRHSPHVAAEDGAP